jgi:DNA-binding response OmpR family regulator
MKRILVIDDEKSVRKSFILALEDTEYIVDTAESGEIGIKMILKMEYDLIYLDLKMPGLNGVETLKELRKIDEDVPVYIVTAFRKEFFEQLKGLQEEGINFEILNKPISSDEIVLVTKSVLKGPVAF